MSQYLRIVTVRKAYLADESDVMTISEAAKVLGVDLSGMNKLLARATDPLTRLIDTSEPNPTKARRVLRSEVLAEKRRRKQH